MAGYLNRAEIIGNLGDDPEIRTLTNGNRVVNMSVATTEKWKGSDGETREKTQWHRIVIWNEGLGKVAEQYLKKGSKVYLAGQIETRKWQDKDGADRYSTEIVLSGFNSQLILLGDPRGGSGERREDRPGDRQGGKPRNEYAEQRGRGARNARNDIDDEIPF